MTTIAYRDGIIAADTVSRGRAAVDGYVTKIVRAGPVLAGASGGTAICQRFLDWVRRGCRDLPDLGHPDGREGISAVGFLVMPDDLIVRFQPGLPPYSLRGPFYALGSGEVVARGALAYGASAPAAVRIAIELDGNSGGWVQVLQRPVSLSRRGESTSPAGAH